MPRSLPPESPSSASAAGPGRGSEGSRRQPRQQPPPAAHLPLGSTGSSPRPQHRFSTHTHPATTPPSAGIRQAVSEPGAGSVLGTVWLTRRHVSHLQDEGGRAGLGLAERRRRNGEGREVGRNQTKTNRGGGGKGATHLTRGEESSP